MHNDSITRDAATAPLTPPPDLAARWQLLRAARPGLRIRDAAAELGTSELELLATTVGTTARWLDDDSAALLHALPSVGRCMALTRNPAAVSEVRGTYGGVELGEHAGQVIGDGIDLRVFTRHWRYTLALAEPDPRHAGRIRHSIQVFDGHGTAVHKIYLEPDGGDVAAWEAVVAAHAIDGAPALTLATAEPAPTPSPDVDVAALHAGWDALQDTHDFFGLLRRHRVTRTQALALAGPARARPVAVDALARVLTAVAADEQRIMVFVGNAGCIQVFGGSIERVRLTDGWLNVLDPGFNLHVRQALLDRAWVVAKPTAHGVVRSLELYDRAGATVAMLFSKRDDRQRVEDTAWAAVLAAVPGVGDGA